MHETAAPVHCPSLHAHVASALHELESVNVLHSLLVVYVPVHPEAAQLQPAEALHEDELP
ncbi:MAG: hypothetical protein AAB449_02200 [Patescibacteria group bacterium]